MRNKKKWLLMALTAALGCVGIGCAEEKKGNSSSEETPAVVEKVDINNGFEEKGGENLFEGFTGAKLSINTDSQFVNTGKQSLKISVAQAAVPKFAFSEHTLQTDISDCEYISFWMYIDGEDTLSLSNTANDGDYLGTTVLNRYYIREAIAPKTWTKIKIEKGDPFFDNMMYYLPYGKFILCGTGEKLNSPLTYDVYLDDVRVFKKGMTGETELYVVDKDNNDMPMDLPNGAVGHPYEIPKIQVLGADGIEVFGAKPTVEITSPSGQPVTVTDGKFTVWEAGRYALKASYEQDGFIGKYSGNFRMDFLSVVDTDTEIATTGVEYTLPSLTLLQPISGEPLTGAQVTVKVESPLGEEVAHTNGKITPQESGCYTVTYTVSKTENGVTNEQAYEKYVWASESKGLVSDFTSDTASDLFAAVSVGLNFEVSSLQAKYQPNEGGKALSCTLNNVSFPSFAFGDKFPYAKASDGAVEYVSFWVYNDTGSDLYLIHSGDQLNRQLVTDGIWNRVCFRKDSFSASFHWKESEFTVYGVENASDRLNGALYFDDLRVYRAGDVEEVAFSTSVTKNDYNETTGRGVRFALNGNYQIDTSVYDLDGTLLTGAKADVLWLKDSNGATMSVTNDAFVPLREGWHTLALHYEKEGVHNSVVKKFFVRPQLEFNPGMDGRDAVMPYGEAGKTYDAAAYKPTLWNKGSVAADSDVRYTLTVTDGSGKKVEANGLSFTPTTKGLYTLSFYAQDPATREFATYTLRVGIFAQGKMGMAYDFEDGDISAIRSTYYWYGVLGDVKLHEENIGGNATKKVKIAVTKEAVNGSTVREPQFYLTENNMLQNISLTKSFSFDIYIEDTENRSFNLAKVLYYNWNEQGAAEVNQGTLKQKIASNKWTTVTVTRENYEKVLGGYIFAGSTMSLGGQAWTEVDDRLITNFYLVDSTGYKECGGINIYLDNFRVEV